MNVYEIKYDEYLGYRYEDSPEKTTVYSARTATQALRCFRETHPLYEINSIRRVKEKETREKR